MLLTAAGALAVVHVIGVLFARPLYRPAELLAVLCLLTYAIHARSWRLSAATAVLVVGAALTVPAPGTGAGWEVFSPEEYAELVRDAELASLAQVTAALLFVLVAAVPRRRIGWWAEIAAGLLIIGYVVIRSAAVAVVLALAFAAVALGVTTFAHRQWRALLGAVLFVGVAAIWLDAAVDRPYEVREYAELFVLDLIASTDSVPQPTQALVAALQLTAVILVVAGLVRADDPRGSRPAGE